MRWLGKDHLSYSDRWLIAAAVVVYAFVVVVALQGGLRLLEAGLLVIGPPLVAIALTVRRRFQ